MAKVKGKDLPAALVKGGAILLSVVQALTDCSEVDPTHHLDALQEDASYFGDKYVRKVAKEMDDLLFIVEGDKEHPEFFYLVPVVTMPLYQAFGWAKARGYENVACADLPEGFMVPYREEIFANIPPNISTYFNNNDRLSRWQIQGSNAQTARVERYDATDMIKPPQQLLVRK